MIQFFNKIALVLCRFFFLTLFLMSCSAPVDKAKIYNISQYIPEEKQHSLLVNIVTFMGYKPKNTNYSSRLDSIHRDFYINQTKNYSIEKYFVGDDEFHYFYIIRPARDQSGVNTRAIGGKFRLGEGLNLLEYEEVFATKVLPRSQLKSIANSLFENLIHGNTHEILQNNELIEWPDERLKYDLQKKEWRFDVRDEK